ncbi:unnamed protein product [Owenia fusiformis]|uniref:Uncharacterized protein n=1 Tax=Owenia fusiformis TaxID=6347 RepID=A0A8J1XIE7_OWEFU|nr:unnamed protein product [Owenia fusiformis]
MATGMVEPARGQSGSPKGNKMFNLPQIEHPMTRMGTKDELNIRGESRSNSRTGSRIGNPMRREQTFVAMGNSGKLHLGLDRSNLPPLGGGMTSPRDNQALKSHQRILTWPPEYLADGKSERNVVKPKMTSEELEDTLHEKLATGYYGVRQLFKANDPTCQGTVTKEALLRILFTLCGYITPGQYNRFLRFVGLEGKRNISFEDFINCFRDPEEKDKREWVSPYKQKEVMRSEVLRELEASNKTSGMSAVYCAAMLRRKAESKNFDLSAILPGTCFEYDGIIVPPQLREAMAHIGMKLTDQEFKKFWDKLDLEGSGALRTINLCSMLGLEKSGRHKSFNYRRSKRNSEKVQEEQIEEQENNEPSVEERLQDDMAEEINNNESVEDTIRVNIENKPMLEEEEEEELSSKKKRRVRKSRRKNPRLESIVDCLHFKFEEPYNAMMMAFQQFDIQKDGLVSRIDFRRILKEFGFPLAATELEYFLSKCGQRSIRGQVNYKEFLTKYQNRSEQGLVNRIVTSQFHLFGQDYLPPVDGETLSTEELEARLVDFYHGDFLHLLGALQICDNYDIGVVTQFEFRDCIEKTLGYTMSEKQWKVLLNEVGVDKEGLLLYAKFMERFNIIPGSWNKRLDGGHLVTLVNQRDLETPVEVENLREARRLEDEKRRLREEGPAKPIEADIQTIQVEETFPKPPTDDCLSLDELNLILQELFRHRFHTIDKLFKDKMDRKSTGRISKNQFAQLLHACDVTLKNAEIEKLWKSFKTSSDGMYSFRQLLMKFCTGADGQLKMNEPDPVADTVLRRSKTTAFKETEQPSPVLVKGYTGGAASGSMKDRLKYDVLKNWSNLKDMFRHIDLSGFASVHKDEAMGVLQTLQFSLTENEVDSLMAKYDLNKDGMFHYMPFLEQFTSQPSTNNLVGNKYSRQMEAQLVKDWKSIRRAFKKFDTANEGYLNVADFRKVLESCKVKATKEDMYHILAQFDTNMDGRISYEEFLGSLLS